ncbi:hypothetical protein ABKW28_10735 [Nocardioides sp. 31GB23]|uniref:hypothetical protein n=1 Tax=Nocardioides sp. 31GB23 TaxID=3156065 RepID=UPI0032AFF7E1
MSTKNKTRPIERLHFVDGVRVRFRYTRVAGARYLCDEHGALTGATCPHALATSLLLAEDLLGVSATMPAPDHAVPA